MINLPLRQFRAFNLAVMLLCCWPFASVHAADRDEKLAFSEKFMFRLSAYNVEQADTDIRVASSDALNLGTKISYKNDLGGDDSVLVPRIDMYYRFNDRHRIEFSNFKIDRDGRKIIDIEIDVEDQTYRVGDTLVSEIEYEVTRVGYAYSFYRSSEVELSLSAGLNFAKYDFSVSNADGSEASSADTSAPLPMFGVSLGYAINQNWSIHYLSETFFIEIGDELKGALLNYELNVQYRFLDHFIVGGGITRLSTNLEASDDDWDGSINDSHRGLLLFMSYYL